MYKLFIVITILFLFTFNIHAERGIGLIEKTNRIALVIGNSNYQSAPLKNPVNDANDMAFVLSQKGFQVTLLTDSTQRQMEKAISAFGRRLHAGGIGLFFYAGHGIQVKGTNYLIPIQANIEAEDDIKYESVDANRILSKMESAGNELNIVFLDACRNNPFARSFRSSLKGLATMEAPGGSLLAFATAPGRTAADGVGRNGLFTGYLIKYIQESDFELSQIMKQVRKHVIIDSNEKQIPWDVSSLTGDFYFSKGKSQSQDIKQIRGLTPNSTETELWKLVENSNKTMEIELYLESYPNGFYTRQAKYKIWELAHNEIDSVELYLKNEPEGQYKSRAIEKIWLTVVDSGKVSQIKQHFIKYPDSPYKKEAGVKIWSFIKKSKNIGELKQYILDFPNSRYLGIAKLKIIRLQNLPAAKTITDRVAGVVWQIKGTKQMNWYNALDYCKNLLLTGKNNWRLPTKRELLTANKIKKSLKPEQQYYWSSNSYQYNSAKAWGIHFINNKVHGKSKKENLNFHCVRDW